MERLTVFQQSDGNGKLRNSVNKVRRAVERINDPSVFGVFLAALTGFFTEECVIGVGGLKCFYNDAFAFFVHFSDIVAETLVRDLKIAAVTESDDLNLAGVASGLNCHVAIGLVVVAIYSSDELFMHRLSGEVNFRVRNFTSRDSSLWTSFPNEGVSASFSFHPATRAISALPQGRLRPWDLTVYTS